jgi:endogenous inhibitor of DNA gyrase (YacG/DUF329 family)
MDRIRCPICGETFDPQHTPAMPFCSDRCRMIDLGRWLKEEHSLPLEKAQEAVSHEAQEEK